MIQVTLNFVSVEALRAALLEIPETSLVGSNLTAKVSLPKAEEVAAAPVEKPAKPVKSTPAATPAPAAPTQPTAEAVAETAAPEKTAEESARIAEPVADAAPASTAVDYPTLQKAVFTLAGKSREAAAAVAASFGVKTFKELPEAKWADALSAVQAKTAEL